jgi:hypothetical protein
MRKSSGYLTVFEIELTGKGDLAQTKHNRARQNRNLKHLPVPNSAAAQGNPAGKGKGEPCSGAARRWQR